MTPLLTWIFSIVAIMLFLHGMASFSKEVTRLGGEHLREILRKLTRTDVYSALVGNVCKALAPRATEHCRWPPNSIGAYFIQPSYSYCRADHPSACLASVKPLAASRAQKR
ncbi:MAG: hypothetical protein Q7T58_02960 [Methylotenera sp.]|nr:hypothetical protein [Methylotenera sp.]